MTDTTLESILKRDQVFVLCGIAGAVALSWVYLVRLVARMAAMPAAAGDVEAVLQVKPWTAVDFVLIFLMWTVMMVGMMVPSIMPAVLHFSTFRRKQEQQQPFAPTSAFVLGFIIVWTGFSLLATVLQWGLHSVALLSPMMVTESPLLGGGLLLVAGVYQFTPIMGNFLRRCRPPLELIEKGSSKGNSAFVMGLENGANCVASSWVVMGLLFVGGVMNLLWVAAITIFVVIEKAAPHGVLIGKICGVVLALKGAFVIFHSV